MLVSRCEKTLTLSSGAWEEKRPDLDERQIPTLRKRMGPPLEGQRSARRMVFPTLASSIVPMARLRAAGGDALVGEVSSISRSRAGVRSPTRTPWVPAFRRPAKRWRGSRSCP